MTRRHAARSPTRAAADEPPSEGGCCTLVPRRLIASPCTRGGAAADFDLAWSHHVPTCRCSAAKGALFRGLGVAARCLPRQIALTRLAGLPGGGVGELDSMHHVACGPERAPGF